MSEHFVDSIFSNFKNDYMYDSTRHFGNMLHAICRAGEMRILQNV